MSEKTLLKFAKSERTGELVGFVSKTKNNKLKGVREDSKYGKRICVLSENLKGCIVPDTLYEVELKPMHGGKNGYVVVCAVQRFFEAVVESVVIPGKTYQVIVRFGGKTVYFDPVNGKTASSRTKEGVLDILNNRRDIANQDEVISDFIDRAAELLERMEQDGYQAKRHSGE